MSISALNGYGVANGFSIDGGISAATSFVEERPINGVEEAAPSSVLASSASDDLPLINADAAAAGSSAQAPAELVVKVHKQHLLWAHPDAEAQLLHLTQEAIRIGAIRSATDLLENKLRSKKIEAHKWLRGLHSFPTVPPFLQRLVELLPVIAQQTGHPELCPPSGLMQDNSASGYTVVIAQSRSAAAIVAVSAEIATNESSSGANDGGVLSGTKRKRKRNTAYDSDSYADDEEVEHSLRHSSSSSSASSASSAKAIIDSSGLVLGSAVRPSTMSSTAAAAPTSPDATSADVIRNRVTTASFASYHKQSSPSSNNNTTSAAVAAPAWNEGVWDDIDQAEPRAAAASASSSLSSAAASSNGIASSAFGGSIFISRSGPSKKGFFSLSGMITLPDGTVTDPAAAAAAAYDAAAEGGNIEPDNGADEATADHDRDGGGDGYVYHNPAKRTGASYKSAANTSASSSSSSSSSCVPPAVPALRTAPHALEACPVCAAVLVHSEMERHLKSAHPDVDKPYVCGQCSGTGFSAPSMLARHISDAHTGDRPYRCDTCSWTFKRKDHLDRHIKSKHT